VNVTSPGSCSFASAAIAVESRPPDRNAPTGASLVMCAATESRRTAAIRSWSTAVRPGVVPAAAPEWKVGTKYRSNSTSPPGRTVKCVPDSTRCTARWSVAGSGTYCRSR
jgi:hypothetical protein